MAESAAGESYCQCRTEDPSNQMVEESVLAPSVNMFVIEAPRIARKAPPGQFVMVRVDERGKRMPMTVAESDVERGVIALSVREVGGTTVKMGTLRQGDRLWDVVKPQGGACVGSRWLGLALIAVFFPAIRGTIGWSSSRCRWRLQGWQIDPGFDCCRTSLTKNSRMSQSTSH
jgi:hypothetical protein